MLRIDHQSAEVLQFDAEHVRAQKVKAHSHHTAQHGSQVRTQHEFIGDACDALDTIPEVLVAGAHTAQVPLLANPHGRATRSTSTACQSTTA